LVKASNVRLGDTNRKNNMPIFVKDHDGHTVGGTLTQSMNAMDKIGNQTAVWVNIAGLTLRVPLASVYLPEVDRDNEIAKAVQRIYIDSITTAVDRSFTKRVINDLLTALNV